MAGYERETAPRSGRNLSAAQLSDGQGADGAIPWERRQELGAIRALLGTVKLLALSPVEGFARMRPELGLSGPLLFGVVVATSGVLLNILGAAAMGAAFLFDLPAQVTDVFEITVDGRSFEWIPLLVALITGSWLGALVAIVVFPPIFVLGLFVWGALLHAALRVIGGAKSSATGIKGTYAVAGYSALAFLAHGIPAVGDLIATVWVIGLQTVGLSTVHRTTRARTFLAIVVVPLGLIGLVMLGELAGWISLAE